MWSLSRVLVSAAVMALAMGAGNASADDYGDDYQDPRWRYSISLAPSFSAPRLNELDKALSFTGISAISSAFRQAGASQTAEVSGFQRTDYGYGTQIAFTYEFDSELRGGVQVGMQYAGTASTVRLAETVSSTYYTILSSTEYSVSQSIDLPVLTIGVFVHRVFHLEQEPKLNLYLGGWGVYGALVAARLEGEIKNMSTDPVDKTPYSIELSGDGWGAGGLGGVEYAWLSWLKIYAETGFEYFCMKSIEQSGSINRYAINAVPFTNGDGEAIPLDFSGIFVRIGAKFALGGS